MKRRAALLAAVGVALALVAVVGMLVSGASVAASLGAPPNSDLTSTLAEPEKKWTPTPTPTSSPTATPTSTPTATPAVLSHYAVPGWGFMFIGQSGQTKGDFGCGYNGNAGYGPYVGSSELHLPDRAVIKGLRAYYIDSSLSTDVSARIVVYEPGQSQTYLGMVSSSGSSANVQFTDSSETTHIVDNASHTYGLEALLGGTPASQICGVTVDYYPTQ